MRTRLLITVLVLVLTPAAAAATPFKATLTAPTHTPKVNAKLQIPDRIRSLKLQINVPQGENFIGVLAHLTSQVTQTVPLRVDGPDDVAHRRD